MSSIKKMKILLYGILCFGILVSCTLGNSSERSEISILEYDALRDSLNSIISDIPGEIGVAVIINGKDTITVNNQDVYPLMSVFKLHQAMALCNYFDKHDISMDTAIIIDRKDLSADTWSPMLKDYPDMRFQMTAKDMMRYTLMQSDNNASNLMFDRFVSVEKTDSIVSTIIPRDGFRIAVSEADMHRDHSLSYSNHSSPLSVAILIDKLFTDSTLLSDSSQEFIRKSLLDCQTGNDRISAPLLDKEGVIIAHKTGSGYIDGEGRLIAHNDAAYIKLPDGNFYSIVVFVKDLKGDEKEASSIISLISSIIYENIASR